MPHEPDISTSKLRRLYEVEKPTLRQIADRVGMTYQAVHLRLKNAGIEFRKRGPESVSQIERDTKRKIGLPRKYTEIVSLEVGQEIIVPKPADWLR